jgi:hypothetical protein
MHTQTPHRPQQDHNRDAGRPAPPTNSDITTVIERPHRSPLRERSGRSIPVLSIRARVDRHESAAFIRQALRDVHAYISEHHLQTEGPPFALCRSLPASDLDVEVGWPLTRPAQGSSRIRSGELPATMLPHTNRTQP